MMEAEDTTECRVDKIVGWETERIKRCLSFRADLEWLIREVKIN
jgi:hypothetical protein